MLTDSLSERLLKGSKLGSWHVKIENMYEPILYIKVFIEAYGSLIKDLWVDRLLLVTTMIYRL